MNFVWFYEFCDVIQVKWRVQVRWLELKDTRNLPFPAIHHRYCSSPGVTALLHKLCPPGLTWAAAAASDRSHRICFCLCLSDPLVTSFPLTQTHCYSLLHKGQESETLKQSQRWVLFHHFKKMWPPVLDGFGGFSFIIFNSLRHHKKCLNFYLIR